MPEPPPKDWGADPGLFTVFGASTCLPFMIIGAKGIAYGGTIIHRCRFSWFGHVDLPDPDTGGGLLRRFVSRGAKAVQAGRWPTLADFRGLPAPRPTEATERLGSAQRQSAAPPDNEMDLAESIRAVLALPWAGRGNSLAGDRRQLQCPRSTDLPQQVGRVVDRFSTKQ